MCLSTVRVNTPCEQPYKVNACTHTRPSTSASLSPTNLKSFPYNRAAPADLLGAQVLHVLVNVHQHLADVKGLNA